MLEFIQFVFIALGIGAPTPTPGPEIGHVTVNAYCSGFTNAASRVIYGMRENDNAIRAGAKVARGINLSDSVRAGMAAHQVDDILHGVLNNSEQIEDQIAHLRQLAADMKEGQKRQELLAAIDSAERALKAQRFMANRFIDASENANMQLMVLGSDAEGAMNHAQADIMATPAHPETPNPTAGHIDEQARTLSDAAAVLGQAERTLAYNVTSAAAPCRTR